jgi:hypothetical protein
LRNVNLHDSGIPVAKQIVRFVQKLARKEVHYGTPSPAPSPVRESDRPNRSSAGGFCFGRLGTRKEMDGGRLKPHFSGPISRSKIAKGMRFGGRFKSTDFVNNAGAAKSIKETEGKSLHKKTLG